MRALDEPTPNEMTPPEKRNYCLECDWAASTADYEVQEVSDQALDHALEMGHDIDSEVIPE